jgi:hypothetical protein
MKLQYLQARIEQVLGGNPSLQDRIPVRVVRGIKMVYDRAREEIDTRAQEERGGYKSAAHKF